MQHPFAVLAGEYLDLLARMQITRQQQVNSVAGRLAAIARTGRYAQVSQKTGIPQAFIATSFEREASSNFSLSPAQGDRWDRVSVHVPRGRGPFQNWTEAALDAYHLDGLDAIGAENWSEARFCYEGELFNGFGYRGHGIHSPYLWAGTNNYSSGKYIADGVWSASAIDQQLGIVPVMRKMIEIAPDLAFAAKVPAVTPPVQPPEPLQPPQGLGQHGEHDTKWLQLALNSLHVEGAPLVADGNYGRRTRGAVIAFQRAHGLEDDGLAGPLTAAALEKAIA